MITIINEKSSQAKKFAKALGGMSGTIPGNGPLAGQPYEIHYAAGHLLALKPLKDMVPEDYKDKITSWDYNDLPFDRTQIRWQKVLNPNALGKGASTYMRSFKASLAKSDVAVIATDNDPSGEGNMIGWEIIDYCHFTGQVYRCCHTSEEAKPIIEAFNNLVPLTRDEGLEKRAEARQKFDLLTVQYARVITNIASKKQVLPVKSVVREGRLKTAMVQLIGNQQNLHENFKPHSDYQPALYDEDGHKFIKKDTPFYKTEQEAKEHINDVPQNATSIELGTKTITSKPPKLLDLSTAGARLESKGYNSKQVEKDAETLYQAEILSYPRTEDNVITPEQLQQLIPLLPKICKILDVDINLLDTNNFRKYLIGNGSHGANRPGPVVPESLEWLENKYGKTAPALYEEFARSFLAGFAKDKVSERHIYADSETKSYVASATVVKDNGWGEIFDSSVGKTKKDDEETKLFNVGQKLTPDVYEKKATRPSLATSTTLQSFLKRNNIGTGATRQKTYNDIIAKTPAGRQLVNTKRGKLTLTKLGMISYLGMQNTELASPKMTKRLEEYLKDVQKGKITEGQLLGFFDKLFLHDKQKMLENQMNLETLEKVKQAGHEKIKGLFKPTGKEVSFANGFSTHKYTQTEIERLLNGEQIEFDYKDNIKIVGQLGEREKYGFGLIAHYKFPEKPKAKGILKETGKEVSFNKKFGSHEFNQDEINMLLDGQTISYPAKSKAGKKYTAKVKLIYSVPYGSKDNKKTWHIGFDDSDFKKKGKKK